MKKICLVTDWYPSKENPYQGLFFKEQAFVLDGEFSVIILRYRERIKQIRRCIIAEVGAERNTREYKIHVRLPISILIMDILSDFVVKKIRHSTVDGVGKYLSRAHIKFRYKVIKKVLNTEEIRDFDILYCVDAQTEAAVLSVFSKMTNKPYIVSEHGPVPWPGTVLDNVNKNAIENANMFLAISNDKVRQLMMLNIKLPPIRYIGNLVDDELFTISDKKKEGRAKTLIIVAANTFYKNYDMFFRIMSRLDEITDVPFRIMIVGYGANKGYSKNIEEFERRIRELPYSNRIELIREADHSEMPALYNRADALVMTSIQEGQPVSAIEAACCGLPIFSTRCGGVEDYVDEKMGRIFSIMSDEEMVECLRDFVEGRLEFNEDYIRGKIVKIFGKKAFIENMRDVFNEAF